MSAARFIDALRKTWLGAENLCTKQQPIDAKKINNLWKSLGASQIDQTGDPISLPPVDGDVQQYDFADLIIKDNPSPAAGFNGERAFSRLLDSSDKEN